MATLSPSFLPAGPQRECVPAGWTSMSEHEPEYSDRSYQNRLKPEDQAKVDDFISRGVNSVERKPFKPLRMVLLLIGVVTVLSIFSQLLARWAGVY